jgi:hypothetical protein
MLFLYGFIVGVIAALLGVYFFGRFVASVFDELEKPLPAGSLIDRPPEPLN